jgi:hypothetical protein
MAEGKVLQQDFTLYNLLATIPMTDDVYLGMQAQNIAVIDMMMLRPLEAAALDEFFSDADRVSGPTLSKLSALSQMWVFALYEFLRTWRQRARALVGFEDELAKRTTDEQRAAYMKEITDKIKAKARLVKLAPVFYLDHVAKVGDKDFMAAIRGYKESTEPLFRDVEAIRMPLAKHEVAGKEKLFAEAPGFGGVNKLTGSMYWQIVLAEDQVTIIERRRLADKFLGIKGEYEPEEEAEAGTEKKESSGLSEDDRRWLDQMFGPEGPAKKQIAGTKRRRRREKSVQKPPNAVEAKGPPELDVEGEDINEFFRTAYETAAEHDLQPAKKVGRKRKRRRGGRRNEQKKESASEVSPPERVVAPKGEWPWKDSLMVVPPEPRPLRRVQRMKRKPKT